MKSLLIALGLVVATATTALGAVISFDTTPGGAGGQITYDGAGGPAVGSGIVFVDVTGVDTPLNSGATFPCVSCSLSFTTGANNQEGPPGWQWNGGGAFVLHGSVPALGIADADLLSGTFTQTPNTPGLAGSTPTGLFIAIGTDTKNEILASFFGLPADGFSFANTEIALGTLTVDPVTNGFTALPNQADIVNLAAVPMPSALVLLGLGLVSLGVLRRRQC